MPNLEVSYWAVAFLDILGMRDALRRLDFDPSVEGAERQRTAITTAVGDTLGVMERFKTLGAIFENDPGPEPMPLGPQVPVEARQAFEQWRRVHLTSTQLGDALVLYVSLADAEDNSPVRNLHALLATCGSLALMQLAMGHPLRGGVDVGAGVAHPTGGLYSAALVKAYDLEAKVAEYPRVVVGETLQEYLGWAVSRPQSQVRSALDARCVDNIKGLICQDTGGDHQIVDYLGEPFRKQVAPHLDSKIVGDAQTFVSAQVKHWQGNRSPKLAGRYGRLWTYFENGMNNWSDHVPA